MKGGRAGSIAGQLVMAVLERQPRPEAAALALPGAAAGAAYPSQRILALHVKFSIGIGL
jgi:hypothetical protein